MDRIHRSYIEHIVTWHCNLKCTNCNTGSPFQPHRNDDLSIFVRDLNIIGKYVDTPYIRLAGGEPTLHPEILDYLREIKKAGYKSNIATNGLTLPQMPDEFFDLVDLFSLSVYANNNINYEKIINKLEEKGANWRNVTDVDDVLKFESMQKFKDNYKWHETGTFIVLDKYSKNTEERAQEVYTPCLLKDMCHSFMNGKYYKCNISVTKGPQYDNMGIPTDWDFAEEDGFDFTGDNEDEIMVNLRDFVYGEAHKNPLKACYYCEGSNTSYNVPHGQYSKETINEIIGYTRDHKKLDDINNTFPVRITIKNI